MGPRGLLPQVWQGKEGCVYGKLIAFRLLLLNLDLEQVRSPKPAKGLLGSREPTKPVINFPVLINSRISPSHYEAVGGMQ